MENFLLIMKKVSGIFLYHSFIKPKKLQRCYALYPLNLSSYCLPANFGPYKLLTLASRIIALYKLLKRLIDLFQIHFIYSIGVVSIAQPLDYERAHEYLLTIQATDLGTPPLSNQATVNITILDSNDNAPVFSKMTYSARISEDCAIGDVVEQVIYF